MSKERGIEIELVSEEADIVNFKVAYTPKELIKVLYNGAESFRHGNGILIILLLVMGASRGLCGAIYNVTEVDENTLVVDITGWEGKEMKKETAVAMDDKPIPSVTGVDAESESAECIECDKCNGSGEVLKNAETSHGIRVSLLQAVKK